jgi:hypothetical protein
MSCIIISREVVLRQVGKWKAKPLRYLVRQASNREMLRSAFHYETGENTGYLKTIAFYVFYMPVPILWIQRGLFYFPWVNPEIVFAFSTICLL